MQTSSLGHNENNTMPSSTPPTQRQGKTDQQEEGEGRLPEEISSRQEASNNNAVSDQQDADADVVRMVEDATNIGGSNSDGPGESDLDISSRRASSALSNQQESEDETTRRQRVTYRESLSMLANVMSRRSSDFTWNHPPTSCGAAALNQSFLYQNDYRPEMIAMGVWERQAPPGYARPPESPDDRAERLRRLVETINLALELMENDRDNFERGEDDGDDHDDGNDDNTDSTSSQRF